MPGCQLAEFSRLAARCKHALNLFRLDLRFTAPDSSLGAKARSVLFDDPCNCAPLTVVSVRSFGQILKSFFALCSKKAVDPKLVRATSENAETFLPGFKGEKILGREFRLKKSCLSCLVTWVFAVLWAAGILELSPNALSQDTQDANRFTVNLGGGGALVSGNYAQGLDNKYNLTAGAGFAWKKQDELLGRHWSLYVTGDFTFNPSEIGSQAVLNTAELNPQIPKLLSATSGTEKFFIATLGPTFRFPQIHRESKWPFGPYAFGGFGVMRRTIDFTGVSVQGPVLQPSQPVAYTIGGTSGAFDAGLGVNVGRLQSVGGLMFYLELRAIHGLGMNSGTTMAPVFGFRW